MVNRERVIAQSLYDLKRARIGFPGLVRMDRTFARGDDESTSQNFRPPEFAKEESYSNDVAKSKLLNRVALFGKASFKFDREDQLAVSSFLIFAEG
jgi:hypothetical protein